MSRELLIDQPVLQYEYKRRLTAITDALRLVWKGTDPEPMGGFSKASLSSTPGDSPLYAEVSVALDIARFLINVDFTDDAEDES